MRYIHSASFFTYLIDAYGLEKFEKIYNKGDLASKIEEVYGKNISEIEKDWIVYVKDKLEMRYFYDAAYVIDQIDPKFFTRNNLFLIKDARPAVYI